MREKETHKYFSTIDSVDVAHYVIERIDGADLPSPRGKKSNLTHMETWEPDRPSPDPARWIDCMDFYKDFRIDDPPIGYEELVPMLQEAAKRKNITCIRCILKCSQVVSMLDYYTERCVNC